MACFPFSHAAWGLSQPMHSGLGCIRLIRLPGTLLTDCSFVIELLGFACMVILVYLAEH
jgi:hypothetical protein